MLQSFWSSFFSFWFFGFCCLKFRILKFCYSFLRWNQPTRKYKFNDYLMPSLMLSTSTSFHWEHNNLKLNYYLIDKRKHEFNVGKKWFPHFFCFLDERSWEICFHHHLKYFGRRNFFPTGKRRRIFCKLCWNMQSNTTKYLLIEFTGTIDYFSQPNHALHKILKNVNANHTEKKGKKNIYCVIISKSYHYDILQQQ